MLIKIIGVSFCLIIINVVLKQSKPEFCLFTNICVSVLIFMLMVDSVKSVIAELIDIKDLTGMNDEIISPILKVVGIGYIAEFSSEIAEESGNKSIASKIVLGGKIAICVITFPILKNLLNAILSLI